VTFRQLDVGAIVGLAAAARLAGIEWGGDVHVPPGDLTAARAARRRCADAGLAVASYGSYLFADGASAGLLDPVLATAAELGSDLVRVWCPFGVEPGAPPSERSAVAEVLAGWVEEAASLGISLYLEFHGGTLTATAPSARALLEEVGDERLRCGWQPRYWDVPDADQLDAADELALLEPWLAHVHVYEWEDSATRLPLSAGQAHWPKILEQASGVDPGPTRRFALLEFVAGDDPTALVADAATLTRWLAGRPSGEVAS
jgi:sugar phosphate isomerase/epimerase